MQIVSDRPDIESHIHKLGELIIANGGFVHPELTVHSEKGGLRITAPRAVPERDRLLALPSNTLLPIEEFDLRLEGDDIVIGTPAPSLSHLQLALMEEMLAIYNLTGKIRTHRERAPSRMFQEAPDALAQLILPNQIRILSDLPDDNFYLRDFLHTREFGAKAQEGGDAQTVLMPLIDFLNHHQAVGGFMMQDNTLTVLRHSPLEASEECFVCYSRMDAQIAFACYGFVDTAASYALSIPVDIELAGVGLINVNRRPGTDRRKKVPETLKDIRRFVPQYAASPTERTGMVSFLVIPGPGFPRVMRRVLTNVLLQLLPQAPPQEIRPLLEEAERQVVDANRGYYNDVIAKAAALTVSGELQPIVDDAIKMATHQLGILNTYEALIARLAQQAAQPTG
jgi:hypothetical protein